MKKLCITTLMLLIACGLFSCAEEQAAQKASVDLKTAATSHAANVKGAAAGQKPATPKPVAAAKEPAAKDPATAVKGAVKASAAPATDTAREPAAAAKNAAKVPAVPTADATKTPAASAQPPTKTPAAPAVSSAKVPAAPAAAQGAAKAPGAPAQTAAKLEDPPPALSVPAGYRYEPRGRRDPFVNPVPKQQRTGEEETQAPLVRPDGLPGVLVSEVKLSGIVHSSDREMNKVMLVVGKNTYFAKKGDSLFDGVIKEIRPNEVVFAMVSATTRKPINRDTVVRTGGSSRTSAGEKK